mgnify:CR=1 FL=1
MKREVTKITDPIDYPESDGKPMAETDIHRNLLFQLIGALETVFPESYVSGNICLYYEEGNPKKMISPDVLLVTRGEPGEKRIFKTWKEAPIDLVIELSSRKTRKVDYGKKKHIYSSLLKVPWYVIFDPEKLNLEVFRIFGDGYEPVEEDEEDHYSLSDLGIYISHDPDKRLRLLDHEKNYVLYGDERLDQERYRADRESYRADQERHRAEQERHRAEEEAIQRRLAEEKIKELELLLKRKEEEN